MLILTGFGLACLLQLFVISLRDFRHLLVGRVFLLVLVASAAYLVNPMVAPEWRWLTSDIQTALPGLFWLMCQLIFAPRPNWKSIWGAMALYSFVAPALARPLTASGQLSEIGLFFGWELGRYFEYVVVLHGLSYVVRHWRDDLVETRRKARLGFLLVIGGAVGVATVSLNLGLYHESVRGVVTSVAAFVTLFCLVRSREGIMELAVSESPAERRSENDEPEPADAKGLSDGSELGARDDDERRLADAMAAGFYRTEKLTLKKLSDATAIPEYRLRKVINQTLGYRNFNDYINQLRVADAAERLLNELEVPVLNISLDVGYRTLSSFNRAFRDIMNTTPTEFRQRQNG
ncbi:helix-turn-helix domain-containing protein [Marinobacter mobilis]|uniref:Transcriptional regulator, AraC family n=1 Tax=Marinobacter mobilis TaxID=488533 RepID=A0A1H2S9Q6_9GAMM|nr:helix-turn-helix domain-containing protein [Marinobacter mobilis]SDW27864.1 transcriptional regulator, AraC family [Marinobacter mobilis]